MNPTLHLVTEVLLALSSSALALIVDSVIEWATHKWPMHRKIPGPFPLFRFLFWHHMVVHHPKFSGDHYHHHDEKERGTIPFPLWVGPLLIAVAVAPFAVFSWYITNWIPFYSSLVVALLYYACFEGFHQLMHMPDYPMVRWVRQSRWFMWLDTHHRLHHERVGYNFNLVCPIADFMFGTRLSYEQFLQMKKPKKEEQPEDNTPTERLV